jgi:hypothetical protein
MPGFSGHDISAVIPTYNRGALLCSTIRSILAQSTPPGEIIVVDDGSTDDTAAKVSQFGTAVKYHRIPNSGAPIARNTGAALAQKPWLWFCDSDDVWRPHYIATVCTLLNASPEPRFVFGNFCLVHDGFWDEHPKFATCPSDFWPAEAVNTDAGPIFIEPLYQRLLHFQPIFHSTLVVSRALFAATKSTTFSERSKSFGTQGQTMPLADALCPGSTRKLPSAQRKRLNWPSPQAISISLRRFLKRFLPARLAVKHARRSPLRPCHPGSGRSPFAPRRLVSRDSIFFRVLNYDHRPRPSRV